MVKLPKVHIGEFQYALLLRICLLILDRPWHKTFEPLTKAPEPRVLISIGSRLEKVSSSSARGRFFIFHNLEGSGTLLLAPLSLTSDEATLYPWSGPLCCTSDLRWPPFLQRAQLPLRWRRSPSSSVTCYVSFPGAALVFGHYLTRLHTVGAGLNMFE